MADNMTMASAIRRIEGLVDINFFANGTDNAVSVTESSKNRAVSDLHLRQIFEEGLAIEQKLTLFDGKTTMNGNYKLIGDESNIGWMGDRTSHSDKTFGSAQFIKTTFFVHRRLPYIEIKGINDEEYPVRFKLTVYFESGQVFEHEVAENTSKVCRFDFCADACYEKVDETVNRLDYSKDIRFVRVVTSAKLEIFEWSKGGVLPRIAYFSGEKHEGLRSNDLKSFEILEEKTGSPDKLSYGISSNYCVISFLNRNKKFYLSESYDQLKKNRNVLPYIGCGEKMYQLGKFYSDEWKLDDKSMFMSCKAYDILFSLQSITINIGMERDETTATKLPVQPYRNKTVTWVIDKIFGIIDDIRRANGLFERIDYEVRLTETANFEIPFVLIEEKSAWDILQDVANLCCAYIYSDRDGKVIIESDNFKDYYADGGFTKSQTANMISIDPDNSFAYSLPVTSRTIVNRVNCEYYALTDDTGSTEKLSVKKEDCIIDGDRVTVVVKPQKVYERIENIIIQEMIGSDFINKIEMFTVENTTSESLSVEFSKTIDFDKLDILINHGLSIKNYKRERKTFSVERGLSINENGLHEYAYKALLFATTGMPYLCEAAANRILNKYQNGVTYVDAEWTGNLDLCLGERTDNALQNKFTAKSQYDDSGTTEVYECLSSEFKFADNFRHKVKGRQLWEGKYD